MQIADLAWCEVDTMTIWNCWRKAGILPESAESHPINPSIPISLLLQHPSESLQENPAVEAKREVEAALDDLVATGALQKTNQMDIESLLNPEGESTLLTEMSDQEIYQAVMDTVDACENIHINGTDDIMTFEVPPTITQPVAMYSRWCQQSDNTSRTWMTPFLGNWKHFWHLSTWIFVLTRASLPNPRNDFLWLQYTVYIFIWFFPIFSQFLEWYFSPFLRVHSPQ